MAGFADRLPGSPGASCRRVSRPQLARGPQAFPVENIHRPTLISAARSGACPRPRPWVTENGLPGVTAARPLASLRRAAQGPQGTGSVGDPCGRRFYPAAQARGRGAGVLAAPAGDERAGFGGCPIVV